MIADALIVTIAILLGVGFWLMDATKFLIPYRHLLWYRYGTVLLIYLGVLSANVFSAVYSIERKFFLKDTGRKLLHIDRQAIAGGVPVPFPQAIDDEAIR